MSPLLGSIGGISEYNYRGNLDDWPNPFIFEPLINVEPGTIVGVSTVITGINYKSSVSASTGSQVSVRNIIGITSIYSGDSAIPTSTVTVSIAKSSTDLVVGRNIRILNVSDSKYNGEFAITSVIDGPYVTRFTYESVGIATTARPNISNAEFNHEVYPFTENQLVYIRNGQILEVRIPTFKNSETDFDRQYRTTVRVGKRNSDWTVRTRSKDNTPLSFIFNNVSGMNVGIATTSNSIQISDLETDFSSYAFISSGIGSFSLNGSVGIRTADVKNGDIIFMQEVSSENYSTTKTSFITVGTYTTSFSVTTRNADRTLDQFNFNRLINVPINQEQVSISTSLVGADNNIPLPAQISSPGELKVNSDNYIVGSTEVFNGDTVSLKIPASAISEYGTTYSTQLTVSGVSSSFFVTTRPRPIKTFPDQFIFTDIQGATPNSVIESSLVTLSGMTVGVADTGLATIVGGAEFRVYRNGSLVRDYGLSSFPVRNSDQIQLKVLSAGEGSAVQSRFTVSGVDTRTVISGINGSTSDTWDVISRLLRCRIDQTSFNNALATVSGARIRELKTTSFTVSGLDNGCDTVITTSNPDSYIRNQNGAQVPSLQPLDIKNGDTITIYMTAAATYDTNKVTTVECKRKNGSDLVSGTWTIRTQVEDRLPDPFNLPTRNQNNVSPCTYRSTFVTESLSGLSEETIVPATVTSTNNTAQISKNGGVFGTTISDGVKNGDRIDIRLKSNCNYSGPCEVATVTVGERTEQWTLCPESIPLPTVNLQANSTSIAYNGSVTLTWTSTSATQVVSSSGTGFVGIGSTQGTITINNLKANTTYSITVANSKGSATSSVNIVVAAEPSPTVTLTNQDNRTVAPISTELPEGIYANSRYIFISGYNYYSYSGGTIEGKSFVHISSDGLSWEVLSPNINNLLKDICYSSGSTFVAVGSRGTIVRTTDNWQTVTTHSIPSSNFIGNYDTGFTSVTYGNGKFVATPAASVSSSLIRLFTSIDGATWTTQNVNTIAESHSPDKIKFLNGHFYLLTHNTLNQTTKIYRSSDALVWTEVFSYTSTTGSYIYLFDIIYDGNVFVAVGNNGSNFGLIVRSTDGINWSVALQQNINTLRHVESNGSLIIAHPYAGSGAGSSYFTSSNGGISWTQRNIQASPNYRSGYESGPIIFDGTRFVSMTTLTTLHAFVCKRTTDGITWDFTNQSVRYRVVANGNNNSLSDSLGRYYTIDAGTSAPGTTSFDLIGGVYYRTRTGMFDYGITVRNSDSSIVKATSIYLGSSNLIWTSQNATSVVSTTGIGFTNITSLNGSTIVRPTQTTEYSITVQNSSGVRATARTTIYISNPTSAPTVSLTSPNLVSGNSISVNPGGSVTLNWTSSNATSVNSYTGFGFVPTTTSGSVTINNINQNTSYSITVTGPGGTVTSNTINVVLNAPTITLSANPTTVPHNGSTTLSWTSSNATSVQSSNFGASSVSGSLVVSNLTSTTSSSSIKTYNITVSGPGGSATASVNVTVLPPGPSVTLTANPASIPYNGSTTLSWSSANAASVQSSNFGATTLNGSKTVSNLTSNQNYVITVVSSSGVTATATTSVSVGLAPPTVDLCATTLVDTYLPLKTSCGLSTTVGYESQVRLQWSSSNATSIVSTSGPSFTGITAVNGTFTLPSVITSAATYSITVSGPGGTASDSITITPTACIPKTSQSTFANYTLGYVEYNNNVKDPTVSYFTSSKSIAYTTILSTKPNFNYGQVQDYISNYYRRVLGRPTSESEINNWTNYFINTSNLNNLDQIGDAIINDYFFVSNEFNKVSSNGGRKGTYNTCNNLIFSPSSSSFTRLYNIGGNYTFIVPPNVNTLTLSGIGAGAGGGTSRQDSGTSAGSGGGGGGSFKSAVSVTPGQRLQLQVGRGGLGAQGGGNADSQTIGQNGGNTSVQGFTSVLNFTGPLANPSLIECGGGRPGTYTPGALGGFAGINGNKGQDTGNISSDSNSRAGAGGGAGLIGAFGNAGYPNLGASNGGIAGCNVHGGSGGNGVDVTTGLSANNSTRATCTVSSAIHITVEDEATPSDSTIRSDWIDFRNTYPTSRFWLLGPGGTDRLKIPSEFNNDSLAAARSVNRDEGITGNASDWFTICNLGSLPAGFFISLAIDVSGSMTKDTVRASYNLFKSKCNSAGLILVEKTFSSERWAETQITNLKDTIGKPGGAAGGGGGGGARNDPAGSGADGAIYMTWSN